MRSFKNQNNLVRTRNVLAIMRYSAMWCTGWSRVKYSRHTLHRSGKLIQTRFAVESFLDSSPWMRRVTNRIYMIFSGIIYMFESDHGILPFHNVTFTPSASALIFIYTLFWPARSQICRSRFSRGQWLNREVSHRAESHWVHFNPVNLSTHSKPLLRASRKDIFAFAIPLNPFI